MDTAKENQLVQKAREGDQGAFSALVLEHQQFGYHVALRAVENRQDAEDILQEAFVKAWKALPGFRGDSRFRTWLYRIIINLCYSALPGLQRDIVSLDGGNGRVQAPDPAWEADPQKRLETRELAGRVQQELTRLPGKYQILLLLRHQQGCSYQEIAEILDLPLGTVKTGLFRARQRLRQAVRESPKEKISHE